MVGCDKCSRWFYTQHALSIHKAKGHRGQCSVPDLIGLGVMKRKLTRDESKQVTNEVIAMDLKSSDLRFKMAIIKAIEITN